MRMGLESQAAKSTSGFQGAIIIIIIKMIFKVVMMMITIRAKERSWSKVVSIHKLLRVSDRKITIPN